MNGHDTAGATVGRRAEVIAALDSVLDPELDESVMAMGFIESMEIDGGSIDVTFRLPTYWCSANFAWLMATDMKMALETLPWSTAVTVRLVDHFAAQKINRSIANGLDFDAAFGGEARANLQDLRITFREKSFLARQETFLRILLARSDAEHVLLTSISAVTAMAETEESGTARAASRYLQARIWVGLSPDGQAPAFTTARGEPILSDSLQAYIRAGRRIRGAAQANAEMCRLHLAARYEGTGPGEGTALVKRPACLRPPRTGPPGTVCRSVTLSMAAQAEPAHPAPAQDVPLNNT